jgi:hypothetical protein
MAEQHHQQLGQLVAITVQALVSWAAIASFAAHLYSDRSVKSLDPEILHLEYLKRAVCVLQADSAGQGLAAWAAVIDIPIVGARETKGLIS